MMRAAAWAGRTASAAVIAASVGACAEGVARPVPLSGPNEACRHCRMAVSNQRFAGQIAAPSEEPLFFDDIGCLSNYLQGRSAQPRGAVAYVADHRTGEWVAAAAATFTRVPGLETPMGSHVIAHASPTSRDSDPVAKGGSGVALPTLFPGGVPEGRR
jgi:copper chaperone NosL